MENPFSRFRYRYPRECDMVSRIRPESSVLDLSISTELTCGVRPEHHQHRKPECNQNRNSQAQDEPTSLRVRRFFGFVCHGHGVLTVQSATEPGTSHRFGCIPTGYWPTIGKANCLPWRETRGSVLVAGRSAGRGHWCQVLRVLGQFSPSFGAASVTGYHDLGSTKSIWHVDSPPALSCCTF